MRTRSSFGLVVTTLILSSGGSGCFAISDLERFHAALTDAGAAHPVTDYQSLDLHLVGMKPHETQYFEYRIVDGNNFVQSRGIVDPWVGDEASLVVPRGIPPVNGPYRLDFFMDMNGTRSYDGIGNVNTQDHAWRIDPLADYPAGITPHVDGAISVDYAHNLSFTDIDKFGGIVNPAADTGTAASIHFTGMSAYAAMMLELRVMDDTNGHTVGLYRQTSVPTDDFTLPIAGVIDPGVVYDVDIYVDANGNGAYDNPAVPGGDLGWRLLQNQSNATDGLAVTFDPAVETNSSVDVGPP